MDENVRTQLREQLDRARWEWLQPHHERGAVFLVDSMLDLVDVATRVAADDTVAVSHWLASRCLTRPTDEQVAVWEANRALSFSMLVVNPYILIQDAE